VQARAELLYENLWSGMAPSRLARIEKRLLVPSNPADQPRTYLMARDAQLP
jgi:hypothetical protein